MPDRHHLTKAENYALYFAIHQMERQRGWTSPTPLGRNWRFAFGVVF
jgi:hypothetical protein